MSDIEIRAVSAAAVQDLRTALLGPAAGTAAGTEKAFHAAALQDGRVVAVASIRPAPMPGGPDHGWLLDGVAVDHGFRGRGIGALVTERCLDHAIGADGALIWARIPAGTTGFFERWNFTRTGEPISGPSGPEYLIFLHLGPVRRSWALDAPHLIDA